VVWLNNSGDWVNLTDWLNEIELKKLSKFVTINSKHHCPPGIPPENLNFWKFENFIALIPHPLIG
jgi:hypothetical protein